jgi:hypothetical protein
MGAAEYLSRARMIQMIIPFHIQSAFPEFASAAGASVENLSFEFADLGHGVNPFLINYPRQKTEVKK